MIFANPTYLYLLLLLIPMIGWYVYKLSKNQASLQVSSTEGFDAPGASSWKVWLRHVPFILRMAAVAVLVVILARPQSTNSWQNSSTEGIDIVLAMDISTSMMAQDLKPNRLGYLGSRHRSDLALVVHTIRQQDNHFRLGLAILDTADSIRQPQTNRRPILDYTRLDILEKVQQNRMVGCQRTLREALRRKHDQTDIIVRTAVDESGRHIFGCFQTVRFQVLRHHTGRDIHCQHDVDTFRRRVLPTVGRLRTRQYHDEDSYRCPMKTT